MKPCKHDTTSELGFNSEIEITKSGKHIYLPCENGIYILNHDTLTGALTYNSFLKDDTLGNNNISNLAELIISNNVKFIYTNSSNDSAICGYSRDSLTGHLNLVQTVKEYDTGNSILYSNHIELSPNNQYLVASVYPNTLVVFSVDSLTGQLTYKNYLKGTLAYNVSGIEINADNIYVFVAELHYKKLHVFRMNPLEPEGFKYIGEIQQLEHGSGTYDSDCPHRGSARCQVSMSMSQLTLTTQLITAQILLPTSRAHCLISSLFQLS